MTSNLSEQEKGQGIALVARSLVKQYKNTTIPALNDFNLHIQKGEFFGLLGANGAGKTTAVSIFSGLFPPDSGSVSIMGKDGHRPSEVKHLIGLVPQDLALYDNLTARENLTFFGKLCGLGGNELQDRIEACLEFARLTEQAKRLVSTFSGGMKRRLNLAAGLLHLPQFLILDEPTVGIDAQSRHLIHEQLVKLNRDGTTILYTTHYMEEAQELCSRIGIIDGGRIVELGTPDALLQKNKSRNLEDLFLHLTGKQLRDT